jgi:psiF repeat
MKTDPRKMTVLAVAVMLFGSSLAVHAQNAQQEKMASCNAQAKSQALKGDERKQFMSTCLSASGAPREGLNSQQQKMKTCSAQAKSQALKGDDRKHFMSTCLKGG